MYLYILKGRVWRNCSTRPTFLFLRRIDGTEKRICLIQVQAKLKYGIARIRAIEILLSFLWFCFLSLFHLVNRFINSKQITIDFNSLWQLRSEKEKGSATPLTEDALRIMHIGKRALKSFINLSATCAHLSTPCSKPVAGLRAPFYTV